MKEGDIVRILSKPIIWSGNFSQTRREVECPINVLDIIGKIGEVIEISKINCNKNDKDDICFLLKIDNTYYGFATKTYGGVIAVEYEIIENKNFDNMIDSIIHTIEEKIINKNY